MDKEALLIQIITICYFDQSMKTSTIYSSFVTVAISALCTGAFLGNACAETYYATGVTADSGWIDTNKAYNPPIFYQKSGNSVTADTATIAKYFPYEDTNMCWAASASNILQYLSIQAGRPEAYSSTYSQSTGNSLVDSLIHSVSQYSVYETFTSSFENNGFNAYGGIAWYTTGATAYYYGSSYTLPTNGGYYTSVVGNTTASFQQNVLATHYQCYGLDYVGDYIKNDILNGNKTYKALLTESLNNGPIALSVNKKDGSGNWAYGHALTCWGFETDDSDTITSLFVTDSDDGVETLKTLSVSQSDDGMLALAGGETKYDIYDSEGQMIGYGSGGSYDDYFLLDFSSYQNFYLLVPEPSGTALTLTGGLFLLLKRKRKN